MRVTCSVHFILGHLITLIFVISGFRREGGDNLSVPSSGKVGLKWD